jgi:hypothetical protein
MVDWINDARGTCASFDFTTKGILQQAVQGELWRLRDQNNFPPGLIGWMPEKAVTFLDNHDTGSTQNHWPFPADKVMQGYAYILTHPGMPSIVSAAFPSRGMFFCRCLTHPSMICQTKRPVVAVDWTRDQRTRFPRLKRMMDLLEAGFKTFVHYWHEWVRGGARS